MSYATQLARKSGTIAAGGDTSADKLRWDVSSEQGRAALVLTVTMTRAGVLNIAQGRTDDTDDALPHTFTESVSANTTKRIVIPMDSSLLKGEAWITNSDGSNAADYTLDGGLRAHS